MEFFNYQLLYQNETCNKIDYFVIFSVTFAENYDRLNAIYK